MIYEPSKRTQRLTLNILRKHCFSSASSASSAVKN